MCLEEILISIGKAGWSFNIYNIYDEYFNIKFMPSRLGQTPKEFEGNNLFDVVSAAYDYIFNFGDYEEIKRGLKN